MPESFLLLSIVLVLLAALILLIVAIKNSRLWLTMSDFTWNVIQVLWAVCIVGLVWKLIEILLRLVGG